MPKKNLNLILLFFTLSGIGLIAQDAPEKEPIKNSIKWSTASEQNNFGFNVHRGDSEEGPFQQLNKDPITGAGNTDETSVYQYDDLSIEPGKAYFYYVESISLDGVREKFTPIFKSKPKH